MSCSSCTSVTQASQSYKRNNQNNQTINQQQQTQTITDPVTGEKKTVQKVSAAQLIPEIPVNTSTTGGVDILT